MIAHALKVSEDGRMFTKVREYFRAFFSACARKPHFPPEELQFLDAVVSPFLSDIQAAYGLAARLQQEVTTLRCCGRAAASPPYSP